MTCHDQPAAHAQTYSITQRVKCLISFNRNRSAIFGQELSTDPAWDLLLQLYAADLVDSVTRQEQLLENCNVPHSVARRWLAALEQRGFVRSSGTHEQASVRLSAQGRQLMDRLFGQAHGGPGC